MDCFKKKAIKFIGEKISYFKNIKFAIIVVSVFMISVLSGATIKANIEYKKYTEAYEVSLGEEKIGIIREEQLVLDIYDKIKEDFNEEFGLEILNNKDFTLKSIYAEDEELTSSKELYEKIKSTMGEEVIAYGIKVDGELVGAVKSEEIAESVIEDFKESYIDADAEIEEIEIIEEVEIEKIKVKASEIQDSKELLTAIKNGTDKEKTYTVKDGENFWEIANDNNITVEELIEANSSLDPEKIREGDEISLIESKPYMTVVTYEKDTYTDKIDYKTKYEKSDSMYSNEKKVKQEGVKGEKEVVIKIEKRNGIKVAKEVISETIKSQPIAQIITKGTKAIPSSRGSGRFQIPVNGRLTSPYGDRGSGFHTGIDLAASTGTTIKASDNGIVRFAGYNGSYGYMILIDHGNGYSTRYAHCSKLYVSNGQKVAKGESIAAVGNTGRSTGPHLHFEVLVNGNHRNPYDYLR
ncbi:peptidoglycan DD-metalloendopeptidase family protein [Clostridium sp. D2Q-14]|uniref:peptidoglycan DD-metalloendopeptidase family protein n=1 Tax=Anaeromonas gelatinilytica TaxID=2683194 RepID=UPI00193BFDAB|nr:M23 family metallopeptidase [Anaeromonas gelatinilytica]MBS4534426.1 peptidoglycan DD-metalloendopeptidase family protein [Anaeromonas gelatinilytica]